MSSIMLQWLLLIVHYISQVVLDCHYKDMIWVNWLLSAASISQLIYLNIAGRYFMCKIKNVPSNALQICKADSILGIELFF